MDKIAVIDAMAALAQDTRLDVFRLLVSETPGGLCVGEISDRLGVRQNTMSTNLAVLGRAGLVRRQREGRQVRYHADLDGLRNMLRYLMEDCCGGKPDQCRRLLKDIITERRHPAVMRRAGGAA